MAEAKLLRATFYILSKQQEKAFDDLEDIIENQNASPKVRANALIKRASLFIQRCKDPQQDSLLSFKDFEKAIEIDPTNADVYHHRGQVKMILKALTQTSFYDTKNPWLQQLTRTSFLFFFRFIC